jgi:hypothetical protein
MSPPPSSSLILVIEVLADTGRPEGQLVSFAH